MRERGRYDHEPINIYSGAVCPSHTFYISIPLHFFLFFRINRQFFLFVLPLSAVPGVHSISLFLYFTLSYLIVLQPCWRILFCDLQGTFHNFLSQQCINNDIAENTNTWEVTYKLNEKTTNDNNSFVLFREPTSEHFYGNRR